MIETKVDTFGRSSIVTLRDSESGRTLDRIERPKQGRMQSCTAGCGKLTRGGGKCFTCETKAKA